MFSLNHHILTIISILCIAPLYAEQIWVEYFIVPDKGIWGDTDGVTIHSDFNGITNWDLEFDGVQLASPYDYAKTVATSGGRFEVCDAEGILAWRSGWVKIKGFKDVSIQLAAKETGSGANESTKYMNVFYRLDGRGEIQFEANGKNAGNWGTALAEQTGLSGDSLQIIVRMANNYSSDKIILDDIVVSGEATDNQPPYITNINAASADTLEVFFNEPFLPGSVAKEQFHLYSETGQAPISDVSIIGNNQLRLIICPSPVPGLTLTVSGIADLNGNIAAADTFAFLYLPPIKPQDVVINEIMADPSPPRGLPEFEFIELFSRAVYPIQTENSWLIVDNTEKQLGDFILLPGKFLVLTPTEAGSSFSEFGDVMPVSGFPALRNRGAAILITSSAGKVIDQIQYSAEWPLDPEKSDGGWSMERIDPNRFCGQTNNWFFSLNINGGTPGLENSVHTDNLDLEPPLLVNVEAISSSMLEIRFSEPIDSSLLKNTQNYSVSDGVGNPKSVGIISADKATLLFTNPFPEDKTYTLTLTGITDECSNILTVATAQFTWSVARGGDMVINEVLSNPYPEGTDFVEFFNNSDKIIHLDHLWFSNGNDTIRLEPIKNEEVIVKPGYYVACTKDSTKTVLPYFTSCQENIFEVNNFPAVYNDKGTVILLNENNEVIDQFFYTSDLYTPFLAEIQGVSLERLSAEPATNNLPDWLPAAESVGFATPGCENSQAEKGFVTSVSFEPESFSPNFDGYNDEYRINYQLKKAGYIANIWIYDSLGRLMVQLVKNEILATEGSIVWDGKDKTGQKLPVGIYVVLLEMFDKTGNINRYKDAVVLTDVFR